MVHAAQVVGESLYHGVLAREPSSFIFYGPSSNFVPFARRVSVIWKRKNSGVCDRGVGYFDDPLFH